MCVIKFVSVSVVLTRPRTEQTYHNSAIHIHIHAALNAICAATRQFSCLLNFVVVVFISYSSSSAAIHPHFHANHLSTFNSISLYDLYCMLVYIVALLLPVFFWWSLQEQQQQHCAHVYLNVCIFVRICGLFSNTNALTGLRLHGQLYDIFSCGSLLQNTHTHTRVCFIHFRFTHMDFRN